MITLDHGTALSFTVSINVVDVAVTRSRPALRTFAQRTLSRPLMRLGLSEVRGVVQSWFRQV